MIVLVSLSAVGLAVTGIVTTASLKRFLIKRVDQQLAAAQPLVIQQLNSGGDRRIDATPFGGRRGPGPGVQLPPGTYGDVRSAAGATLSKISVGYEDGDPPEPKLPTSEITNVLTSGKADTVTVGSTT